MTAPREQDLIGSAWMALSGHETEPASVVPVELTGLPGHLPSTFAVSEVAVASVAVALQAAVALATQRGGRLPIVTVDRGHVADAVRSERFFTVAGRNAGAGFAPLSRFWATADGWVRTHANYPWHRRALIESLGTTEDPDAVAEAMATLGAEDVEQKVFAAGGIATAIRTLDAWLVHPQGRAVASEPLISHRMTGDAAPRRRPLVDLPMTGFRVLDLTRVIAGPVCTRYLGALGADVLRVDPPGRPDMSSGSVADTLLGKRSTLLELDHDAGVATLHHLLEEADVVVCGYRPGSLDRFGLDEESLVTRHPGLVAVFLDAWGHRGPWAGRRGFDSVVQGPTGIAMGEAVDGNDPGALPCQLLDHGTGYLAAAAVMDGLRRQNEAGGTHVRRLSLARTALWLTAQGMTSGHKATSPRTEPDTPPWRVALESAGRAVTAVAPPGSLGDRPLRWPGPLTRYGADPPRWPED